MAENNSKGSKLDSVKQGVSKTWDSFKDSSSFEEAAKKIANVKDEAKEQQKLNKEKADENKLLKDQIALEKEKQKTIRQTYLLAELQQAMLEKNIELLKELSKELKNVNSERENWVTVDDEDIPQGTRFQLTDTYTQYYLPGSGLPLPNFPPLFQPTSPVPYSSDDDDEEDLVPLLIDTVEDLGDGLDLKFSDFIIKFGGYVDKLSNVVSANIEGVAKELNAYIGNWDAHLQTTNNHFGQTLQILNDVQKQIGASPYVKQQDILKNIDALVKEGVSYNLEERAYLATIANKTSPYFDATGPELLQMIRLQQADLTNAQMGAEATLIKLFNDLFQDTAYLAKTYDSVQGKISGALSQLASYDVTGFTYNVEKWLGSLYELGMSDTTVDLIATGINNLATGNVQAMGSNNQLQTLFALSAANSGMDYASMLVNGINADNVNNMLRAITETIATVANGADNQVVKSAWANILGTTVQDMRAFQNISSKEIQMLYDSAIDYSTAMEEVTTQLSYVPGRTHISQEIDNLVNNAMFTFVSEIMDNEGQYIAFQSSKYWKDISNALDLTGTKIDKLASGITRIGNFGATLWALIETMGDVVSSIGNGMGLGGFMKTGQWAQYTTRGSNFQGITGVEQAEYQGNVLGYQQGTAQSTLSYSASMGTTSAADSIETLATSADKITETSTAVVDSTTEWAASIDSLYDELFNSQSHPIRVKIAELEGKVVNDLNKLENNNTLSGISKKLNEGVVDVDIRHNYATDYYSALNNMRSV